MRGEREGEKGKGGNGARLRGKHFCKQLAKNVLRSRTKNAIKVASNATCLLKYFVGRQNMLVRLE